MSRSRKRPIVKDKGICGSIYNRKYRTRNKAKLSSIIHKDAEEVFDDINSIVNQYDICDYIMDFRDSDIETQKKFSRK